MQAALSSCDRRLRVATWSVIAGEAVMFAMLFVAHGGVRPTPTLGELSLAAAIAGALIAASLALTSALRHVRTRQPQLATRQLGAAMVLGTVALGVELIAAALFTSRDAVGLILLGLHASHVAAAVALAGWVAALARSGRVQPARAAALELVTAYWYFVAVMWAFVGPLITT